MQQLNFDDYLLISPTSIVTKETTITGNISYTHYLKVYGTLKGNIQTQGFLYIAQDAKVLANIKARFLMVEGTLQGEEVEAEEIRLTKTAKIKANLKTSIISIEDGAQFEGRCEII